MPLKKQTDTITHHASLIRFCIKSNGARDFGGKRDLPNIRGSGLSHYDA